MGAFFDPDDRTVWSGMLSNVLDQLGRLGLQTGYLDATPWPLATRAARRWLAATDRLGETWTLRAEMRAITALSNLTWRARTMGGSSWWLHPAGAYGRPVSGKIISLAEISPAQLVSMGTAMAGSFGLPGLTKRGLASVVRQQLRLHRKASACCVASRWAAHSLVQEHGIPARKVHVIGYGRNIEVSPPPERDWSEPHFLFVGNDWGRKNGDAVLRAFARLKKSCPGAQLDLVGNHPPVELAGVTGHGRMAQGPFAFDEPEGRIGLARLFEKATCLVVPSLVEPFGIVYVEAAAAGIASIATAIGGTADSVGAGGILVDPYDDLAIYSAMRHMADADTARSLGALAMERSAGFTWEKVAQRILRAMGAPGISTSELAEFL